MTGEVNRDRPGQGPGAQTDEEIETRARELLAQMSLDEEIAMMSGDADFWTGFAKTFSGDFSQNRWPAGGAVPRLGIDGILYSDGPRGVVSPDATTFPVAMARGATWDPEMEERVGNAIGRELRARGLNTIGSVCINVLRHPSWGRSQETFGEDTHHLGILGAAHTRGLQRHVMACVKHYACNSIEEARFKVDVTVDERALREVYLPHFKRVVDEGVASVMSAYNSVNGEWCGQNRRLLGDILKDEWGFDGFVVTDFIFGVRDGKKAALAGLDLDMPFRNVVALALPGLMESGEVPVGVVHEAALRLLRQQLRFTEGADGPDGYGEEVVASQEHRRLALDVARRSIVLLKNDNEVLPLKGVRRLAVIGRLASIPNTGDHASSDGRPPYIITPLQGLRNALGDGVEIVHDDGSDPVRAVEITRGADAAVCVVGNDWRDEGEYLAPADIENMTSLFPTPTEEEKPIANGILEAFSGALEGGPDSNGGDREPLTLHPEDEALVRAVTAANPKTIVALMSGGALITESWREEVPAILMLWYPGMEGGNAFADVLTGRVNPSGKLPCTFPKRAEDLPFFDKDATEITYDLWHGYRKLDRDGAEPAFHFGFGLSYTTFEYDNLRLERDSLNPDDTLAATVDVTNAGDVAGEEVVQLYVAARGSAVERAPKELKAFARVPLSPDETRTVRLEVPVEDLAHYDTESGWVVEPITYEIAVARSAGDAEALRATVQVG